MTRIFTAILISALLVNPAAAAQWLKQSTAATIKLGPFLDSVDGVTAETGLTISQSDIRLSKNGGDIAQTNNAAGATHDELGYYDVPLDTTDTGTLGRLRVAVSETGALPVWMDFIVVPANTYDTLVLGTDALNADVDEIASAAITTDGSVPHLGIIDQGTAQSATSTTLVLRAASAFANSELVGARIVITGGTTGVGQSEIISANTLSNDTVSVSWTTTPTGTITYKIFSAASSPDVATILAKLPSKSYLTGTNNSDGDIQADEMTGLEDIDAAYNASTDFKGAIETIDSTADAVKVKTDFLPSATAGAANGLVIAGTNAPIVFTGSGDAFSAISTGGNGRGIYAKGNGSGSGNRNEGGSLGHGQYNLGGSSSGSGQANHAQAGDSGMWILGVGVGSGMLIDGGASGDDILLAASEIPTFIIPSVSGSVASVTGNVAGNVNGSVAGNVSGNVVGSVGSVASVANIQSGLATSSTQNTMATQLANIYTGFELDASVYRLTTNALEQAPTGGGATAADVADAVWDELKSDHSVPDSYGDFLDDEITSIVATGNITQIEGTDATDTIDARILAQLQLQNLDHFAGTAAGIPAVPADTWLDLIMKTSGGSYNRATDSLEAIRDRGDAAWGGTVTASTPETLANTTIATLASQTSFTITSGPPDDNALNGSLAIITDSADSTQKAFAPVADYVGNTGTVTLERDPAIFTMAAGDSIAFVTDENDEGPIEHTGVPNSRTLTVRSRNNGEFGVVGRIRMAPGETTWWAVDLAGTQLSAGDLVDSVDEPTLTGDEAANMTVSDYGIYGTKVKVKCVLSGSATTSDEINVRIAVSPESGESFIILVPVTVGP